MIRLLQDNEVDLMTEAWRWSEDSPTWFKESFNAEKETLQDFISGAKDVLLYGIFTDGLTSVIRLNPCANKIFSIDLFAKRKTDWNLLAEAGKSLQLWLYDKGIAESFFGWLPRRNRGILRLYYALGFTQSGISCYKGQMHDRPIEWILLTHSKNY